MIPGKRFTLADGKDYVIPPLTFRQVRELDEEGVSKRMVDPAAGAQANAVGAFLYIHRALARNYPDLKPEEVEALLDAGLLQDVLTIVLGKLRPEDRVRDPQPAK